MGPARYDGVADWYDEYISTGDVTPVALRSVERLLGSGTGRCLDLGCGTGIAFSMLAGLGWNVVGVDLSSDQLEHARLRAEAIGASLVEADATSLPFADGSFEAVVSILTSTDFDDLGPVCREAARVLRPGGAFVLVGVHPCFAGPMAERPAGAPPVLGAGYRQAGWWPDPDGPVRRRVGAYHRPLADLLNTMLDAGFRLQRVEEPGGEYPMLLSLRATV
jgi:SAM-dependent methyltransferase